MLRTDSGIQLHVPRLLSLASPAPCAVDGECVAVCAHGLGGEMLAFLLRSAAPPFVDLLSWVQIRFDHLPAEGNGLADAHGYHVLKALRFVETWPLWIR